MLNARLNLFSLEGSISAQRYSFFLIISILGAAILCLAGCDKAVTTTQPPQQLKLNLTINNGMAPATKSVKTEWTDGDKVYVFFGKPADHPTPAYLTLTRSGSSWTETWTEGLEAEIAATTDGTLTAFFSPIDIGTVSYMGTYGWYDFSGKNHCFALSCNNAAYTVSAGVLSSTLDMTLTDQSYVQFSLPGASSSAANLTFSNEHILKSQGASGINDAGEVSVAGYDYGDPIPGFAFDGGVIFSGSLSVTESGKEKSYTLIIMDNKGTDDVSDDVTYTLTKTATISQKDAILLPSLSEWSEGEVHEYVEMGDGLKWATMNIGATKPEEYGDYFAWGETAAKTDYSWSTYFDTSDGGSTFTKYPTDKKTVLDLEDDAARQIWKGTWRIPTDAEWTALRNKDNFKWEWTDDYEGTGIAGQVVTSKVSGYEGNTIFLPAAGYRSGPSLYSAGNRGFYWSSSLNERRSDFARGVDFSSGGVYRSGYSRADGLSVRPVSE